MTTNGTELRAYVWGGEFTLPTGRVVEGFAVYRADGTGTVEIEPLAVFERAEDALRYAHKVDARPADEPVGYYADDLSLCVECAGATLRKRAEDAMYKCDVQEGGVSCDRCGFFI